MDTARTKSRREVRIVFEPTRIAAECLADAYARLVPLGRRRALLVPRADQGTGVAVPRERERREGRR
jgi:hypothetical protein